MTSAYLADNRFTARFFGAQFLVIVFLIFGRKTSDEHRKNNTVGQHA